MDDTDRDLARILYSIHGRTMRDTRVCFRRLALHELRRVCTATSAAGNICDVRSGSDLVDVNDSQSNERNAFSTYCVARVTKREQVQRVTFATFTGKAFHRFV